METASNLEEVIEVDNIDTAEVVNENDIQAEIVNVENDQMEHLIDDSIIELIKEEFTRLDPNNKCLVMEFEPKSNESTNPVVTTDIFFETTYGLYAMRFTSYFVNGIQADYQLSITLSSVLTDATINKSFALPNSIQYISTLYNGKLKDDTFDVIKESLNTYQCTPDKLQAAHKEAINLFNYTKKNQNGFVGEIINNMLFIVHNWANAKVKEWKEAHPQG